MSKRTKIAAATVSPQATNYAQDVRMNAHSVVADEPEAMGGTDAGASPYQLLLASLGACTTITLKMYADKKDWALGDMLLELTLEKDEDGRDHIHRQLSLTGDLSDEQWDKLLGICAKTPVTRTLLRGASIDTTRAE